MCGRELCDGWRRRTTVSCELLTGSRVDGSLVARCVRAAWMHGIMRNAGRAFGCYAALQAPSVFLREVPAAPAGPAARRLAQKVVSRSSAVTVIGRSADFCGVKTPFGGWRGRGPEKAVFRARVLELGIYVDAGVVEQDAVERRDGRTASSDEQEHQLNRTPTKRTGALSGHLTDMVLACPSLLQAKVEPLCVRRTGSDLITRANQPQLSLTGAPKKQGLGPRRPAPLPPPPPHPRPL